jgi:predicted esterase
LALRSPILALHGERDRVVPISFGERLAASWSSRTSEVCTINTSGFDFR